jgi:hypothetical protein
VFKPNEFKTTILNEWDKYCADSIIDNTHIALDPHLRAFIGNWDFALIRPVSVDMMVSDPAAKSVLYAWFGADPGPAPVGSVPLDVLAKELPYIRELVDAYGERECCTFSGHSDVKTHPEHGPHLAIQRERFFDADEFLHHYRDNTFSEDISALRRDVYYGIYETHREAHHDSLSRVNAVMKQAASTQPSGTLAKYARVPVKQGTCHHFVNEGTLTWRKK